MADLPTAINSLEALGFSEFFRAQIDETAHAQGWIPGRIIAQHRGEWDVLAESGTIRAVLAGRLYDELQRSERPSALQPTVGDWVLVARPTEGRLHVIEKTLQRRTHLERGAAGRRREPQTIVANVDVVVILCALPPPGAQDSVAHRSINPRRIERYLSAVAQGGADSIIGLNKADLCPNAEEIAAELRERFAPQPVVTLSTKIPGGLQPLEGRLSAGCTAGLVGLSGVGKSSVVNALLGRTLQRTSAAREQDARGRHTTTHRELFVTEAGVLLIDTPGMREFALSPNDDELGGFEDVMTHAAHCRFRDCRHRGEPGCAVAEAIRQGLLTEDRVQSYRQLAEELTQQKTSRARGGPVRAHSKTAKRRPAPKRSKGTPRDPID